ncbi:MAG: hypothetical protein M3063_02995 [Actinomycetota bacterium]|nr:hypothetical protein [Actinomycetota bacterium]
MPRDLLNAAQSFLAIDAPEHTTLRRLNASTCSSSRSCRWCGSCIFDQLLHRVPDIEVGDPVRLVGNVVGG